MNTKSPGDIVLDTDQDDPDKAIVVNTPPMTTDEWELRSGYTVADDNPSYDPNDDLAIIVYQDTLDRGRPNYSGHKPIKITDLNDEDITHYAYPSSRLTKVDTISHTTVDISNIRPSPYHARKFAYEDNVEFIQMLKEQGVPTPYPTLRIVGEDSFEIVNGHKRIWASAAAGIETINAHCVHLSDWEATKEFVTNHLDGSYSPEERETTIRRLRDDWEDQLRQLPIKDRRSHPSPQSEAEI
jgi:ParB family chromosome partitioning protein